MRSMHIILIVLFSVICTDAFAQVVQTTNGFADLYSYDASGQRIKRKYIYTIIAPKQSGQEEQPVDTLSQKFEKDKLVLRAYPNPVANQMIIENLNWRDGDVATVRILDITGKLLQTGFVSSAKQQFSLGSFAPGTYQVHYYLGSRLVTTWKIVKQ